MQFFDNFLKKKNEMNPYPANLYKILIIADNGIQWNFPKIPKKSKLFHCKLHCQN